MKKRKLRKPRWMYILPNGTCVAMCTSEYGINQVRLFGFTAKPAKVEQLAKWFTAAAAWMKQEEK